MKLAHQIKIKVFSYEKNNEEEKHTSQFIENLVKNLDEGQKKLILEQMESRLDDNLHFLLRFDKSEYLKIIN